MSLSSSTREKCLSWLWRHVSENVQSVQLMVLPKTRSHSEHVTANCWRRVERGINFGCRSSAGVVYCKHPSERLSAQHMRCPANKPAEPASPQLHPVNRRRRRRRTTCAPSSWTASALPIRRWTMSTRTVPVPLTRARHSSLRRATSARKTRNVS